MKGATGRKMKAWSPGSQEMQVPSASGVVDGEGSRVRGAEADALGREQEAEAVAEEDKLTCPGRRVRRAGAGAWWAEDQGDCPSVLLGPPSGYLLLWPRCPFSPRSTQIACLKSLGCETEKGWPCRRAVDMICFPGDDGVILCIK